MGYESITMMNFKYEILINFKKGVFITLNDYMLYLHLPPFTYVEDELLSAGCIPSKNSLPRMLTMGDHLCDLAHAPLFYSADAIPAARVYRLRNPSHAVATA